MRADVRVRVKEISQDEDISQDFGFDVSAFRLELGLILDLEFGNTGCSG